MTANFTDQDIPAMAPTFRLQWEDAQDCYVILYPEGMVKLNAAAGEILHRCDGKRRVADIITELEEKFPDAEGLNADVIHFLSTAHEQQWIQQRHA